MEDKCFDCDHELELKHGYTIDDPFVGIITVQGEYLHCPNCGADEVPYETMKMVSEARRLIVDKLLWESIKSSGDFDKDYMKTHELADFLGITRQAISQSKTLANCIFNVKVKGEHYWLKKSVELFKETGDGRFRLVSQNNDMGAHQQTNSWVNPSRKRTRQKKASSSVLTPAD